ncbi:MAG: hypothetical protein K0Q79_840 [Flavipsychrobacter sp.]|jgi:hypothetical protein|nr:hypothetical protein [Flavipsychrobacter sp.]
MEGMHHWSGAIVYNYYNKPDSIISVSYDFPITKLNDTTMLVSYDSSALYYSRSNDSEITFEVYGYKNKYFYDTVVNSALVFNYLSNKIKFNRITGLFPAYSENLLLFSQ